MELTYFNRPQERPAPKYKKTGTEAGLPRGLCKGLEKGWGFQAARVTTPVVVLVRIIGETILALFHEDYARIWKSPVRALKS